MPPLPPHSSFEQARLFVASLVKGDPDARGMVEQAAKEMVAKYVEKLKP